MKTTTMLDDQLPVYGTWIQMTTLERMHTLFMIKI